MFKECLFTMPTLSSFFKNIFFVVVVNAAVVETASAYLFDDEFNDSSLDSSSWVAMNRPGDSSNSESQYYLPMNVTVSNGNLSIISKVDSSVSGYSYTSGMIQWKSFNFTYGTVEFRAIMAGGKGTWPAIWLLGANCQQSNIISADNTGTCNWPTPGSDEIDITEIKGDSTTIVHQNLITSNGEKSCLPTTTNVTQNWHTYTLVWGPGSLIWQIDGVTTCTINSSDVPSKPMFIMINTALGGSGGTIVNSTLPQTLSVDYVRVSSNSSSPLQAPTNLRIVP